MKATWEKLAVAATIVVFALGQFYFFMDRANQESDRFTLSVNYVGYILDEVDYNAAAQIGFWERVINGERIVQFTYSDDVYKAGLVSGNLAVLGDKKHSAQKFYQYLNELSAVTSESRGSSLDEIEPSARGKLIAISSRINEVYAKELVDIDRAALKEQYDDLMGIFDDAKQMFYIGTAVVAIFYSHFIYESFKPKWKRLGDFVKVKMKNLLPNKPTRGLHNNKRKAK